jgi:hypothetical protein
MTWEALAGWLQGPMDAAAWEAIIPSMGHIRASAESAELRRGRRLGRRWPRPVAARIADPETGGQGASCSRSGTWPPTSTPTSLRWGYALEQALGHSLRNVPALPGRTLVLVDRSGSMFGPLSAQTQLNRADSAAVFGTAVALRAASADLVEFGTSSRQVKVKAGESVLRVLERFHDLGGTNTTQAVREHYRGHDRVLIVTDEQAAYSYHGDPTEQVPAHVPVYTWNLAGYQAEHGPSGSRNRHTFGGLTDAAFRMVPLLEAGRDAAWPWED